MNSATTVTLPKELEKKAAEELHEISSQRQENLLHIREWLKKQPHLNARTDDLWLLNFLRGCKFNMKKTKEKIDTYYACRDIAPELFKNRDPFLPEIQTVLKKGVFLPLESHDTSLVLIRWSNIDPKETALETLFKVGSMIFDIALNENNSFIILGNHVIDDFSNFPVSYAKQFSPSFLKKMFYVFQYGYPSRLQGFHIINAPSIVKTTIDVLLKHLLNKKLRHRFHAYEGYEGLYKHIPKSALPKDYGGDAYTVEEIIDSWKKKVESYRDWFIQDATFGTDETKRFGKPKITSDLFGVEGSFRKLEID